MFQGNPKVKHVPIATSSVLPKKAEESSENSSETDGKNDEDDDDKVSPASASKSKSRKSNASEMVDLMTEFISQQQIEERDRTHNEKKRCLVVSVS